MSTTLPVASTTATFTPVRRPGSRPMVARGPAGAASSRSFRLRAKTLIASISARFAQAAHQLGFQVHEAFHAPGPAHRVGQPFVGRAALVA